MSFHMSLSPQPENMPIGKSIGRALSEGPRRLPLGEMTPNAKVRGPDLMGDLLSKSRPSSPLKRGSISVLDENRGLKYFKRRRLSETEPLSGRGEPRPSVEAAHVETERVKSEMARFRRAPVVNRGLEPGSDDTIVVLDKSDQSRSPEPQSDGGSGHDSEHSAATKASFSSLINYDPSSQLGPGVLPTPAFGSRPAARASSSKTIHQITMGKTSQAEMLRLRLRVAMYKVRTNQIYVPFARLRIQKPVRRLEAPQTLDPALTPGSSPRVPELASRAISPGESDEDEEEDVDLSAAVPEPVLRPTNYSSRLTTGPALARAAMELEASRSGAEQSDQTTTILADETTRQPNLDLLGSDDRTIVAEDVDYERAGSLSRETAVV